MVIASQIRGQPLYVNNLNVLIKKCPVSKNLFFSLRKGPRKMWSIFSVNQLGRSYNFPFPLVRVRVFFFLTKQTKNVKVKTHLFSSGKVFFNKILNHFFGCMWIAWCTRIKTVRKLQFLKRQIFYEFLNNCIFRKLIIDFENRIKRKANAKKKKKKKKKKNVSFFGRGPLGYTL